MNIFCHDRDLLCIEPIVFLSGGFPAQELIHGTDGTLSATTFTSQTGNFVTAGIDSGMVLCTYSISPAEGCAWEIISVDSPTQLTVSVLRADTGGPAIAPSDGTNLSFHIRTFIPQIRSASDILAEKLRQLHEVAGIQAASFADSAQLRLTAAFGTLASIFTARAEGVAGNDVNWVKAELYRQEFCKLQMQLRLASDVDGDGRAERTRTLGNVTLRRQ